MASNIGYRVCALGLAQTTADTASSYFGSKSAEYSGGWMNKHQLRLHEYCAYSTSTSTERVHELRCILTPGGR